MKTYTLPTGYLFTDQYSKGELETLSIGDYGKRVNVKADFLGFTKEINGVPNTTCMPLSEKWVMTLSTQYGCVQKCTFCDVPKVRWRGNASYNDLLMQLRSARNLFPDVKYTERLNIHFARMGEPIFNNAVFEFARWIGENRMDVQNMLGLRVEVVHPVLTTSCPVNFSGFSSRLQEWVRIKNDLYNGQAGLQLSINSTCDAQRDEMFGGSSLSLYEISRAAAALPDPLNRKYCLNFAYSSGYEVDGKYLASLFDPERFMCKITPIHNNNACREHNIQTLHGYSSYTSYREPEESLKQAGYDVLVFIPSLDEEHGLVTCGNAVLGGGEVRAKPKMNIEGIATS